MATQQQIEATYDYLDEIVRLEYGPYPEVTAALYDVDFSKTLAQAQRDKHAYVLRGIGFEAGNRVLDVGCGWGPFLHALRLAGGRGVGITLSPKQAAACVRNGLDVHLLDWKELEPETFGGFDAVVNIESLEHFCSMEEYLAGRQEQIYRDFFRLCRALLPGGGRLYLQSALWGENAPPYQAISLRAPKGSVEYLLAVCARAYPGTWMPRGVDQVVACAAPWFRLVERRNGRRDFIETMNQWDKVWRPTPRKVLAAAKALRYFATDPDFRYKVEAHYRRYNKELYLRGAMDHERVLLEAYPA